MSAAQLTGVKNLVLLIPGIFFAVATVIAILHPLSEKKLTYIQEDMVAKGMDLVGECTFEEV